MNYLKGGVGIQSKRPICIICNKLIEDDVVKCSICGAYMHKGCVDEEVLSDAEGNILCPSCALRAALDWADHILSLYAHSIRGEDREELRDKLKTLLNTLS